MSHDSFGALILKLGYKHICNLTIAKKFVLPFRQFAITLKTKTILHFVDNFY